LERDLDEKTIRDLGSGNLEVKVIGRDDDLQRLTARLVTLGFDFTVTDHVRGQPIAFSLSMNW
jgi:hypothetical protein